MALRDASEFMGFPATYAVPNGATDLISGSADLIRSTCITQQVVDSQSTANKCIHDMEFNTLYA